jgi:hypothetical protein
LIRTRFLLNIRVAPCISPMVFQLSSLILGTVFPLEPRAEKSLLAICLKTYFHYINSTYSEVTNYHSMYSNINYIELLKSTACVALKECVKLQTTYESRFSFF